MELYVLRHAMAVDSSPELRDAERTITDEGRERLRRTIRSWDGLGVVLDGILTSPIVRARQTADVVAAALGIHDRVEECPALGPGARPVDVVSAIAQRFGDEHRVMVVGHEPDLGRFVSLIVCGDDGGGFRIKKAGLTKLTVDGLAPARCAVLEWHLWPRHMLRMA
ncbi:phosphohistidine phosphatase SixA [Paraliomyxa miuraensis]|uniref:phosphohistidine phosphatase SixA n=1 Tax=Paraliomyxa miuraensis TaxID=376150 RepID=UPI00225733C1|nr:phosphohistidine phosphatase SixA [Paraliomyxa miuraensis]MCX4240520.1 phosphohistidine phosphatase SixA [Paraliomyxa miuraensis]